MTDTTDYSNMSMIDLFRVEAENHCAVINDHLLELEKVGSADNADLLEALMRASHSIKGAARVINLDPAVKVAHAMEDVFSAAQNGSLSLNKKCIDVLLSAVDMISTIAKTPENELADWPSDNQEKIETLVQTIKSLADGQAGKVIADMPAQEQVPIERAPKKQAQNISDMSMMDLFRMEAENHCATLNDNLLALEDKPDAGDALLESLMRASHSIKGAARIVNLDNGVKVAHAMEDVFVAAQKNTITLESDGIDILLAGVDFLTNIAQVDDENLDQWNAENQNTAEKLVKSLRALQKGKKAEKSAKIIKKEEKRTRPSPVEQAQPPADEEKKTSNKPPSAVEDRSVRVSAQGLNRLMGLAGEVQVESRWLPDFTTKALHLKRRLDDLHRLADNSFEILILDATKEKRQDFINEIRDKVEFCRATLTEHVTEMEDHARRATEISHRLYHEVIANRMRPFLEGIRGFPRMVRDLSHELGKDVKFEIIGEDTLVDRDILEKIEAPLNHLLRNSLDHGLELPDEREKAGKPKTGLLRLEARHSSGMLNIIVSDDGHGVDYEKLRASIIKKHMIADDIAKDLTDSELLEFLFLPNFSTKKEVSKVSGRGVGLDVVHNVVHEVRGVVRASSKTGKGTRFEMQLPLTLSVLRALLIDISGEPYAVPLVAIDHIQKLPNEQIKEVEGRQYFTLADRRVGLVSARQIFEKTEKINPEEDLPVIVLSDRLNQYGLIVDQFLGIRDLVVQALDPRLGKVQDISASAILEDGAPVLIIDVEDIVRSMDNLISDNRLKRVGAIVEGGIEKAVKHILVADDSITVREVERKMLDAKGYKVDVAVDGMDAWNAVRSGDYDLVVTDVDMPRMNGIELVSLIKNDPRHQSIPIIIVSYKDREEDRNRGLEAGADYYLTKGSFQDETLVNAVEDLIGLPDF